MSLRLLLDENSESQLFKSALIDAGHDVVFLRELSPKGTIDEQVLSLAVKENRTVFTRDRGFRTLATKNPHHKGIILEYLTDSPKDMTISERIKALAAIDKHYPNLKNQFVILNSFRPKQTT